MINLFNPLPENIQKNYSKFGLCLYNPNLDYNVDSLKESFEIEFKSSYINIFPKKNIPELDKCKFEYIDAFSPNLHKDLHIGHLNNLVIGKALYSLGIANNVIALYGDLTPGNISKEESLSKIKYIKDWVDFYPNKIFYASQQKYLGSELKIGIDKYEGTFGFYKDNDYIVGIKSDESTSYFYQDYALANSLNKSTLYITGKEQSSHFKNLKYFFPNIDHIPCGLVTINGKKMSTRENNSIYINELFDYLMRTFKCPNLSYNIIAGILLNSSPKSDKSFTLESFSNLSTSPGLYISYTMARLHSVKLNPDVILPTIEFSYYIRKSQEDLNYTLLFKKILDYCKKINNLYETHRIIGNSENIKLFSEMYSNLLYCTNKLGLFKIDKI